MAASLLVGLVSKRPNNVSTDCWALSSIASIDCCYVCTLYSYSQIIIRERPVVTISNEGGTMVQSPGQPHIITPWRLTCPLVCPWHCLSPLTISPICLSQPQKGYVCLRVLLVLILTIDKAPRLSISIVIWILSSDTVCHLIRFVSSTNSIQIVRRQCCLLDNVVDNSGPQVYGTTGASYGAPSSGYGAPSSSYAAPSSSYGSRSNYDYQVNRKKFLGTVSKSISVNQRKYFVHWNRNIRFSLCLY